MYLIVDHDSWWRHPETFSDFNSAFQTYNSMEHINNATIEFVHDDGTKEMMWCKDFENVDLYNDWHEMPVHVEVIQ